MLATIGYEKAELQDFVATLKVAGIELLIDIREVPSSRRTGFSKKALSTTLIENGIDYIHLKNLGDPKEGRNAAREGRWNDFLDIFLSHLDTGPAQEELHQAAELANHVRTCLLCYERDPDSCHRKIVAERLSEVLGFNHIDHLGVRANLVKEGCEITSIKDSHSRQSATTA